MSSTSNKEIIRLAKIAKKNGWKFTRRITCDRVSGRCCFLGGAAVGKYKGYVPDIFLKDLYVIFGRSPNFINGVITGFDNDCDGVDTTLTGSEKVAYLNGFKLGKKARKLFLEN